MISIQRLDEPDILRAKKEQWDRAYEDRRMVDRKAKPRPAQYAHEQIKRRLQAMSHFKCFYCEQSVKGRGEIDHYIECAERPDLAYDWKNLYLACFDCNHSKIRNGVLPVDACVDPCDSSMNPAEHLAFQSDLIRARNNSERGRKTIRKYALDRPELDSERRKLLLYFMEIYSEILVNMNREGRQTMRDDEREILLRFAQADAPFSLMFRCYLPKHGL